MRRFQWASWLKLAGCAIVLGAGGIGPTRAAPAQTEQTAGIGGAGRSNAAAQNKASAFSVSAETFGVGGVVRPGALVGIRVAVENRTADAGARTVVVCLWVRDQDGDQARVQRAATLTPGRTTGVWLYARAPYDLLEKKWLRVTLHEPGEEDGEVGATLATGRVGPTAEGLVSPGNAILGVVGSTVAGLERYTMAPQNAPGFPATGHELVRVVRGIKPGQIPDAWYGLAAMDAIVWTAGEPAGLRPAQTHALEQWVRRGGRLIVCTPEIGAEAWLDNTRSPIAGLAPSVRLEPYDLTNLRSLGAMADQEADLGGETVRAHRLWMRKNAAPQNAVELLCDTRGGPVAVARPLGGGQVVVVGLPLGTHAMQGTIEPNVFWRRVLGGRFDVLTHEDIQTLEAQRTGANFSSRRTVWADKGIGGRIGGAGYAGGGVLLGIGVLGAYLLAVGGGGFFVLRSNSLRQYGWGIFAGTAAVFAVGAWLIVQHARPGNNENAVMHETVLEHVYGQTQQRARVWASVYLPGYGTAEVAVRGDQGAAVQAWDDPETQDEPTYPDARAYTLRATKPNRVRVPTRETVKQCVIEWLGTTAWRMPRPVQGKPIAVQAGQLTGAMTHEMPAALDDVTVVYVAGQTTVQNPKMRGELAANAHAWRLSNTWKPGETLDLGGFQVRQKTTSFAAYARRLRDAVAPRNQWGGPLLGGQAGDHKDSRGRADRLREAAYMIGVLPTPTYDAVQTNSNAEKLIVRRKETHGWDAQRWFTRPCVIVTGVLRGGPCPVEIEIDGATPEARGDTVVRWVYPLQGKPPGVPTEQGTDRRALESRENVVPASAEG